ncbi:MipA/OmpV family protein [Mesobacterium sp. TK19101]|uniref:MipA/OmpV family protein n=1 Tax=Mesobacterium hydrothermale TaxID=3111907 RepID=A0ABU6HKJ0_9RHOB|nr:MipA/OmpV family protein [Mesobacterium sp. TK19101]MEC3862954.1 MipA/OmpV family protein [Mesobacterium sp. TK19101]
MKLGYVLVAPVLLGPGFAVAQQATEGATLTFGAGVVATSGFYVGQDDEVLPFPVLMVSHGDWTADLARGIRYAALSTDSTRVEVGLAYRFGPDLPETALFDGLDRDGNVELVASLAHAFDAFDIAAEVGADISSVHDGFRADLSVGRTMAVGLFHVGGRLGVEYFDADFGNHLYGVRPDEATASRGPYSPGETLTPRIELSAALPFENGASLVGFVEYRRLPDAVTGSPLVADRDQTSIGLSLMRSF